DKRPLSFLAKGAQTVMPPSRHHSGRRYAWVEGRGPDDVEAAPMPAWLVEQLRAGGRQGAAPPIGDGEAIEDGRRDNTLPSLAATRRGRGMPAEEIDAALQAVNRRCVPPMPEEQVTKIAHSVACYKPGAPAGTRGESRNGAGGPAPMPRLTPRLSRPRGLAGP